MTEHTTVPQPNVENDIAFMDAILKIDLFEKEVIIVNNVRLYLKVYFLSEIIPPQQNTIRSCSLQDKIDTASISLLQCPNIPTPTSPEWRIWRKALHPAFPIPTSNHLRRPPSRIWRQI